MKQSGGRRGGARGALLAALAVLTLFAAGFEHWVRPAWESRGRPTGTAEWIWPDAEPGDEWTDVYAVRDFRLSELPAAAEIVVTADEEYTLYLNGEIVGVGGWGVDRHLDRYAVEGLLVRGDNRLLVRLASSRAVGGFILRLAGDGETYVVSDASWQLVGWYREHLKWPAIALDAPAAPHLIGRPPSGRWGRLDRVVDRRLLPDQLAQRGPLWPARLQRGPGPSSPWVSGAPELLFAEPVGRWVTVDFGREQSAYLGVLTVARAGLRGYFWTSSAAVPDPRLTPPTGRLRTLSGEGAWTDVAPRRFRYATIVATAEIRVVNAFPLDPILVEGWVVPNGGGVRVLGLEVEPPASRLAVEDEFWRQVESLEGAGGGE